MSFRKRNIDLTRPGSSKESSSQGPAASGVQQFPGVRPSPVDGRPTTSTGTGSLDGVLAGHAGLPLGCSLLFEESGTTDYAGALLKYYAAEGVLQGHEVHVIGVGEQWGRELPGIIEAQDDGAVAAGSKDRMKIAWRYERLGDFDASATGTGVARGRASPTSFNSNTTQTDSSVSAVFCHTFDLTKRLSFPAGSKINYYSIGARQEEQPFKAALQALENRLLSSSPNTIHRLVIPSTLSPALYPPQAAEPQHVLQFFHALRSLLRQFSNRLTLATTIPLELFPRSAGLVRWMELLSDGVFELTPFPHAGDNGLSLSTSGASTAQEERPQGLIKIHKMPVFHERGGGGGGLKGLGNDLSFTVSRRKFVIKPFNLPPADGGEAQQGNAEGQAGKLSKDQIEF